MSFAERNSLNRQGGENCFTYMGDQAITFVSNPSPPYMPDSGSEIRTSQLNQALIQLGRQHSVQETSYEFGAHRKNLPKNTAHANDQ